MGLSCIEWATSYSVATLQSVPYIYFTTCIGNSHAQLFASCTMQIWVLIKLVKCQCPGMMVCYAWVFPALNGMATSYLVATIQCYIMVSTCTGNSQPPLPASCAMQKLNIGLIKLVTCQCPGMMVWMILWPALCEGWAMGRGWHTWLMTVWLPPDPKVLWPKVQKLWGGAAAFFEQWHSNLSHWIPSLVTLLSHQLSHWNLSHWILSLGGLLFWMIHASHQMSHGNHSHWILSLGGLLFWMTLIQSEDSQDDVMVVEEQVAHLPAEHVCKKQKLDEPVPVAKCLDQIKWVGSVPFVLSHGSQKIHCGRSVMCRTKVGDLTVVHCLTNCCILGGHPDGQNCGCFCHLLAKSYQYQWPPTSIEG